MNFSLGKPVLTKQLILSKITEEQIFAYYLKHDIRSKKLFCSRLRTDHRPTCSMYRNKSGTLIYRDFATNDTLDSFGYIQKLFGCSYSEALRIIANDFNIVPDSTIPKNRGKVIDKDFKITEKEFSKIQVEIQDFSELELKWWIKYGITSEILKKFKVFSCKNVFLNENLCASSQQHCPIYGYYGGKIKKDHESYELWKIYFPKRKEYRFMGNYPSNVLQGYKQLPKKGNICVITKSLKDVMALYAYNIPACAPNSETVIPKETIVEELLSRFKHVFALWDTDLTGVTFLNKIKRKYPKLHCLIIPRDLGAKDFSDLRSIYGYQKTKNFIIQYLNDFNKNLHQRGSF